MHGPSSTQSAPPTARRLRSLAAAFALALGLGIVLAPARAEAKAEVFITEVSVPEGPQASHQAKLVRGLIGSAVKRARFGKVKNARIRAKLTDYEEVVEGE